MIKIESKENESFINKKEEMLLNNNKNVKTLSGNVKLNGDLNDLGGNGANRVDPLGWISKLKKGKLLEMNELRNLCKKVKEILCEEANLVPVNSPVNVCGDIHGQFNDLLELFRVGGEIPKKNYIFMGDLVDRGYYGVEVVELLLSYKIKYPQCITLLRGNHESRMITKTYGFYEECLLKYNGDPQAWRLFMDVFDYFNISAIIDSKIFCVHGGLSPDVKMIDQIALINRKQELPYSGPFTDLLWSDPEDSTGLSGFAENPRLAGWLFGDRVVDKFSHINDISLICRAHQIAMEGYRYMFDKKNLITVWSAPNYCGKNGNVASILQFDEYLDRTLVIFDEVKTNKENANMPMPEYFV